MKRAVILHGTNGHPSHNWQPWLRKELEKAGYEVWAPELPENDTPNRFVYEKFLKESNWDFSDNLIIGHSSGATTVLNLLSSDWFPHIKAAVLLGAFLNEKLTKKVDWYKEGQFDNLFPTEGFDASKIKLKADHFYFIHGKQDGYCDPEDARKLSDTLGGTFVLVPDAGHFSSPVQEIPELLTALHEQGLI